MDSTKRGTLYRGVGAGARGREAKTSYRIVMKFFTEVGVPDVITHAKFDCWGAGVEFSFPPFPLIPLTSAVVLNTVVLITSITVDCMSGVSYTVQTRYCSNSVSQSVCLSVSQCACLSMSVCVCLSVNKLKLVCSENDLTC